MVFCNGESQEQQCFCEYVNRSKLGPHGCVHVMQGVEVGSGFEGSEMLGSEHNDEFYMQDGEIRTRTNR